MVHGAEADAVGGVVYVIIFSSHAFFCMSSAFILSMLCPRRGN